MNKIKAGLNKELLLLLHDKIGLLFMFVMPLVLVFIITVVQDSAFKRINNNQISLLIVNHDSESESEKLVEMLNASGMFNIKFDNTIQAENLKKELLQQKKLTALYIPKDFSNSLKIKAESMGTLMLKDFELFEQQEQSEELHDIQLSFYHDPTLQEAYTRSIVNVFQTQIQIIENQLIMTYFYEVMGIEKSNDVLGDKIAENQVVIHQEAASMVQIKPNTTQHNVPAWTIFAMFFMVVSLGNNMVKERLNGSFIRLRTMPVHFSVILGSKMLIYMAIAFLQIAVLFSIGVYIFPLIELPRLIIPNQLSALLMVVFITALSAVSYAIMIGSLAKTQEQANGIGAISIIIFAAIGGILIPVFAMPEFMKIISQFSPLYWCLESFYFLFLKGGNFVFLLKTIIPLVFFIILCLSVTYISLRKEKIM